MSAALKLADVCSYESHAAIKSDDARWEQETTAIANPRGVVMELDDTHVLDARNCTKCGSTLARPVLIDPVDRFLTRELALVLSK